jgi:hypothetical protein
VDPGACLDDVEKRKLLSPSGLELRHLGRPASSQSLYRPRFFGSAMSMEYLIVLMTFKMVTRDSAVGIATGYGLDD